MSLGKGLQNEPNAMHEPPCLLTDPAMAWLGLAQNKNTLGEATMGNVYFTLSLKRLIGM